MTMRKSDFSVDERSWIIQIRRTLDSEIDFEDNQETCIFHVPKTLIKNKEEFYIPQLVSLGPYHYRRFELLDMERYKIMATKMVQNQMTRERYDQIVEEFMRKEHRIRSCYHRYLDFNGETLAWMMMIDASFLLEFLRIYASKDGQISDNNNPSKIRCLCDNLRRKSFHNSILRDVMMMENQIPLFLLRKIMECRHSTTEESDEVLSCILMDFLKEISPLRIEANLKDLLQKSHLLELLYLMMIPKEVQNEKEDEQKDDNEQKCVGNSRHLLNLIEKCSHFIRKAIISKPMKLLVKIPWIVVSNTPIVSVIKQPLESLLSSYNNEQTIHQEDTSGNSYSRSPLLEEIAIPSVSELCFSGVKFSATFDDLSSIDFDTKNAILYLPTISLDLNTEVILRNLIAFEASNSSGPLIFARYIEFMNGIIDSEEDVVLLRENGIILNHLKSDTEVADLWNGMSKSMRISKVKFVDRVIEDLNTYYSNNWKVKIKRIMKKYLMGSWNSLGVLVVTCILSLMSLQVLYSVYRCSRFMHIH